MWGVCLSEPETTAGPIHPRDAAIAYGHAGDDECVEMFPFVLVVEDDEGNGTTALRT